MVEEKNNSKYFLIIVAIVAVVAIVSLWMMGMDNAFKVTNNENIITADDSDKSDLAGQAIKGTFAGITKEQQKQLQKLAADTTTCNAKPDGYIIKNADKTESLCIQQQAKVCNIKNIGKVQNAADKFDALCFGIFGQFKWYECDADNQIEKKGDNGIVSSSGTTITAGNHDYLCSSFNINGKNYESWIGCNGKIGPDGVSFSYGQNMKISDNYFICHDDYSKSTLKSNIFFDHWFKYQSSQLSDDGNCLKYYHKEEPKKNEMCSELLSNDGGSSIHSQKISGGYICKPSPFPEEKKKDACPNGVNTNFNNELEYSCYSSNSFNFKGCLNGYKLNFDFSQKASAPNHFSVACILDADDFLLMRQKAYPRAAIACGNSGAIETSGNSEGYCCAYTEK